MHDPFEPSQLQISIEQQPTDLKTPKPRRRKNQFVMVPQAWVSQLNKARHIGTAKVAHHLLFQHWRSGGKPTRLANTAMARIGVSRREKWRALQELEMFGLVSVLRRPRKSPEVTLA